METNSLLTEEEMAALLESSSDSPQIPGHERRRRVVPYNFRRPDRLSKEQVRALYLLHDLFSHSLSSSLPIFLRTISEVTLISVEQQAYVEYLYGLPDPTAIFTLSMHPLQGVSVLELNPSLAFPVIDRLLGGKGEVISQTRAVTEIEQQILEGFLKVVVDDLREAWKPLADLEMEIIGRETRPQLLQIVAPNEVVLAIVFHVQVGAAAHTHALIETLSAVTFPVAAELHGTTAAMEDLLNLAPGDVLRMDHAVDQPVEISVGGIVKFNAELAAQRTRTIARITGVSLK